MARSTGPGSTPSRANGSWVAMPGWAMARGRSPRCGQVARWTRNGWQTNTSPAAPVAKADGRSSVPGERAAETVEKLAPSGPYGSTIGGDVEVRADEQLGGCVVGADVVEQDEPEQPALARLGVDPPGPVGTGEAAVDVPAGVAGVVGVREPDRDGPADAGHREPSPFAEQLVVRLVQHRLGPGRRERRRPRAGQPDDRAGPGRRVVGVDALVAEPVLDLGSARGGDVGRHRTADR